MPNVIPAPIPPATATASGVVSTGAQVLGAGMKTFSSGITVAKPPVVNEPAVYLPAPVSSGGYGLAGAVLWSTTNSYLHHSTTALSLNAYAVPLKLTAAFSTVEVAGGNGTGASDAVVKVGTSRPDASVNASATLLGVYAGIGGTEVQSFLFRKGGVVYGTSGNPNLALNDSIGAGLQYGASYCRVGNGSWSVGTINWSVLGNFLAINAASAAEIYSGSSVPLVLRGGPGAGASDVAVKAGTTVADGSVHASAKLFSIRTGFGGTEVERYSFTKDTVNWGGGGVWSAQFGSEIYWKTSGVPILALLPSGITRSGYGFDINPAFGANLTLQLRSDGRIDQSGTDSSGTPGAATINKPSGISAIAGGATTVTITNSLVTASSRVRIDWYGDLGTQTKQPWITRAAGSFTVNVGTAPAGAVAFGWEVSSLI